MQDYTTSWAVSIMAFILYLNETFFLKLELPVSIKLDDVPGDLQSIGVPVIVYLTFHVGGLFSLIKHRAPSGAQIPNTHTHTLNTLV